jgi:hypothetical protein
VKEGRENLLAKRCESSGVKYRTMLTNNSSSNFSVLYISFSTINLFRKMDGYFQCRGAASLDAAPALAPALAPAPSENFDAAPAAPAPAHTLLNSRSKFLKSYMFSSRQ